MSVFVCRCEEEQVPLCGFCRDDLFCPQCGSEITSISSDGAYGDENVIWVHADDNGAFEFPISLQCHDNDRKSRSGLPDLDLQRSKLNPNPWFESKLVCAGQQSDGQAMRYQLQPQQKGKGRLLGNFANQLPPEGVVLQLDAEGGFRTQTFSLHVCRKPGFYLKFTGFGALPNQDEDKHVCNIWRHDELPLAVQIVCNSAPLKLKKDAVVSLNGVVARIEDVPLKGELLKPGEAGCEFRLILDTKKWQPSDADRSLGLTLNPCGTDDLQVTYQFCFIELGDLGFSCGKRLTFPNMHFGESQSRTIEVTNVGTETVNLDPPAIRALQPATEDWLQIALPGNEFPDEKISLGSGESFNIVVSLDLSRQHLPTELSKQDFQAEIALQDELDRPWAIQIRAPDVTERPQEIIRWLAIDFGSTNTYAAMVKDLGGNAPPIAALFPPGHEEKSETFTTAIFFHDVASQPPKYEIGPNAMVYGDASPLAFATGFKRWIGIENGKQWHITDNENQEAKFDASTLMKLFLRKVIERCDEQQRIRVSKVGLSFPANLDKHRIKAMEQILAALEHEFATATPPRVISIDPPRLDEATAVALSFSLAPEFLNQPVAGNQASNSVVVASFDFGGGTIDTALLQLTFHGNRKFAVIESKYLGIGGDEFCGGENVTLAVVEILLDRIRALLAKAEAESAAMGLPADEELRKFLEIPVARPGEGHSELERRNFDLLWAAAEAWKVHLCTASSQPAAELLPSAAVQNEAGAAELELAPAKLPRGVEDKLSATLGRLVGRFENSAKRRVESGLFKSAANQLLLEDFILTGQVLPGLPDIYQHRMQRELGGGSHGTIQERVQACITELSSHIHANLAVDYLILAGASSRLPLVQELIKQDERLRDVKIVFDSRHAKSKVAHGLIRYLDLREKARHRVEKVRGPLHYVPYPIGIWEPALQKLFQIIPAYAQLAGEEDGTWYRFREATVADVLSDPKQLRIELHTVSQKKLGSLELLEPCDQPVKPQDLHQLWLDLRLGSDVNIVFARLVDAGGNVASGPWQMKPV